MAKPVPKVSLTPSRPTVACPIHDLIARIGDKWSMMVLVALDKADGHVLRFSELLRAVDGISQRMLSTTLRYLERDGIVTRKLYAEVPPRVEYSLTARGRQLLVPVKNLVGWIHAEWLAIEKSRKAYDDRVAKPVVQKSYL